MFDIAINGIDLGRGRGGNESYLNGLLGGLAVHPQVHSLNVLVGAHFDASDRMAAVRYVPTGPYLRLPYLLWQQSLALRKLNFDWYLSTFFLPLAAPRNSAVFIHDLSFLALPTSYPVSIRLYMRLLVGFAARRAQRIIVLSKFVRSEFHRYYPDVPLARIAIAYPASDPAFSAEPQPGDRAVRLRYDLPDNYLLCVSSIHPRKNLSTLLKAYESLLRHRLGKLPSLVIVGGRYWGNPVFEAQAQACGARLLGYVPQADLPAIYRSAIALAYPSIYEGFGLPPLEAMASGVPVICGNNTSLPEVVGCSEEDSERAAILVDVQSPEQIADALTQIVTQPELHADLRQRGLARARRFNWRRSAESVVSALCETVSTIRPASPDQISL